MTREAEDDALLAGMAAGDRAAAAVFVQRHAAAVTGVAYHIVRDRAVAEEVAQETFLRAWKAAATYDPRRGSAKAWLLSISRNAAIDLVRVRQAAPLSPEAVTGLLGGAESILGAPDDRLIAEADAVEVRHALRRLPEEQRRALLLAAVAGRSAAEVAEIEGIPLGTAKTRIRTALLRMRDCLEVEARRGV